MWGGQPGPEVRPESQSLLPLEAIVRLEAGSLDNVLVIPTVGKLTGQLSFPEFLSLCFPGLAIWSWMRGGPPTPSKSKLTDDAPLSEVWGPVTSRAAWAAQDWGPEPPGDGAF